MNSLSVNVDSIKAHVIQSKSETMIHILVKTIRYGILVCVIVSVVRHVKLTNIWTLKIAPAKNVSLVN